MTSTPQRLIDYLAHILEAIEWKLVSSPFIPGYAIFWA